ncbi:hypothetical protein ABG067_006418 [Albugo candida]
MKLAKQVMMKSTDTEMWTELVSIYEGKTNPAMTAQKVYRLQGELHRTHLRGKGNVATHEVKENPDDDRKNTQKREIVMGEVATHEVKENPDDDRKNTQKREIVMGEVEKLINKGYEPCQWYFDSGSNIQITACKEYFTTLQSMDDSEWNPDISGFADGVDAKAEGFETILLSVMIDEQMVFLLVEDDGASVI